MLGKFATLVEDNAGLCCRLLIRRCLRLDLESLWGLASGRYGQVVALFGRLILLIRDLTQTRVVIVANGQ